MASDKKLFTAYCVKCQSTVPVQTIDAYWGNDEYDQGPPCSFHLCSCPQCKWPIVMGSEIFSGGYSNDWQVYPSHQTLDSSVPDPIRSSFEEASSCLRNRSFTAAAIMCRRAIEAACAHFGERGPESLFTKLKTLHQKGVLDQRLYDWADTLRDVGNEAAHSPEYRASPEEAKEAVEFTRALLEMLFVIEVRFRAFKQKRSPPKSLGS